MRGVFYEYTSYRPTWQVSQGVARPVLSRRADVKDGHRRHQQWLAAPPLAADGVRRARTSPARPSLLGCVALRRRPAEHPGGGWRCVESPPPARPDSARRPPPCRRHGGRAMNGQHHDRHLGPQRRRPTRARGHRRGIFAVASRGGRLHRGRLRPQRHHGLSLRTARPAVPELRPVP